MYIDFKQTKNSKNPFFNPALQDPSYNLNQFSKYQYSIQVDDDNVVQHKKLLKRNHYLVLHVYPESMARSNTYRQEFFRANANKEDKYRCRYCGRRLKRKQVEVDHIYPVRKAKTKAGQRYLLRRGMDSVNDPKNLCAACHSCNRRKSNKGGIWLLKAKLGQYKWWYWITRRIVLVVASFGFIYALFLFLYMIFGLYW